MKKILGVLLTVVTVGVIGISLGSTTADSRASERRNETHVPSAGYRSGIQVTEVCKKATSLTNTLKKNRAEKRTFENQQKTIETTPVVQEQLIQEQLTQEAPVVETVVEEASGTQVNQTVGACDGRFHATGVCDNTCVNNSGSTNTGHHMGSGMGICDGTGHYNGVCDGSCVNNGSQGTGQTTGQGTGNHGYSSTHGNGHGNGHRGRQ